MQIVWFQARNYNQDTVIIGKDCSFRFKKKIIEQFNITTETRFLIGQDVDNDILVLYFVFANINDKRSFKMTNRVNGWTISGKGIVKELKLYKRLPIEFDVISSIYAGKSCIKLIEKTIEESTDIEEKPQVKVKRKYTKRVIKKTAVTYPVNDSLAITKPIEKLKEDLKEVGISVKRIDPSLLDPNTGRLKDPTDPF